MMRRVFGVDDFRPGQEEVIRSVMRARDTLAVMPTGSGKSLCYQLPGLELEGTTVVVSPLIALMKDQADHLGELDVPVASLNSTLSATEEREAEEAIRAGQVRFIYATPERMADP